jgi:hypothetical protein
MRWVLTYPNGVEGAIAHTSLPKFWTRGPEPKRLLKVINETPVLTRIERLSIYGDGYFLRLVECLGGNFESVKNLLGEDLFSQVARDYLVRYPSFYKCIDNVGKEFAVFLKNHPALKNFPYADSVAAMDWAFHESFYADDNPPFNFQNIKNKTEKEWEKARLQLDPSVRLLTLTRPVLDLWRDNGKWSKKRLAAIKLKKQQLLVFRRLDKQVRVVEITSQQRAILSSFQKGQKLARAIGTAKANPAVVELWFREWIQLGVIQKVNFE